MATQRTVSIAIIGLATFGCFDPGALMPDSEGRGGAGAAAGSGGTAAGRGGRPGGRGGTTGVAGTSVPPGGITLVTNGDGWLEANPSGALGSWWSVNDYVGADGTPGGGDCAAAGFPMSACSMLTTPTPGTPFRPDPDGRGMCTSGTSAQVLLGSDGAPAWSVIWGNIIAVNLATPDPSPMAVLGSYDAPAHGITGFAFDIDAPPVGGHIRVMFATPRTENHAAYWSGAGSDASPISGPGHYAMRWPEINGPFWFNEAPSFDPTKIEWIAFHVVSTTDAPVPFDFCLRNLVLLTD